MSLKKKIFYVLTFAPRCFIFITLHFNINDCEISSIEKMLLDLNQLCFCAIKTGVLVPLKIMIPLIMTNISIAWSKMFIVKIAKRIRRVCCYVLRPFNFDVVTGMKYGIVVKNKFK